MFLVWWNEIASTALRNLLGRVERGWGWEFLNYPDQLNHEGLRLRNNQLVVRMSNPKNQLLYFHLGYLILHYHKNYFYPK